MFIIGNRLIIVDFQCCNWLAGGLYPLIGISVPGRLLLIIEGLHCKYQAISMLWFWIYYFTYFMYSFCFIHFVWLHTSVISMLVPVRHVQLGQPFFLCMTDFLQVSRLDMSNWDNHNASKTPPIFCIFPVYCLCHTWIHLGSHLYVSIVRNLYTKFHYIYSIIVATYRHELLIITVCKYVVH